MNLKKLVDEHLNIVVYLMALQDHRYDLFFKMMGGENYNNYKYLQYIKLTKERFEAKKEIDDPLPLNPDGSIYKNHYQVAISILLNLPFDIIRKKIWTSQPQNYKKEWLIQTFTDQEQSEILAKKESLVFLDSSNSHEENP